MSTIRPGSLSLDDQISAVVDDGSPEGIAKVKLAEGHLVMIPVGIKNFTATNGGFSRNYPENDDGSMTGLLFNIAAAGAAGGYVSTWLYGRTIGVRWDPGFAAGSKGLCDFCLLIDKVPYQVTSMQITPEFQVANSVRDGVSGKFIVRDLVDGWHYVEFMVPTPPAGSANAQCRFFGYLVDRAAGYTEYPRLGTFETPQTLTGAVVAWSTFLDSGQAVTASMRGFRGVLYRNTAAAARTVYIQVDTGLANWVTIYELTLAATGTAGAAALFPPAGMGDIANLNTDWSKMGHYASNAGDVTATVVKAY